MDRKEASLGCGEDGKCLLNDVCDERNAEDNPHCDGSRAVPFPCASCESKDYLEENKDGSVEECSNPIYSSKFGGPGEIRLRVVFWEDEDIYWCKEYREWKIEVEGPPPGRR